MRVGLKIERLCREGLKRKGTLRKKERTLRKSQSVEDKWTALLDPVNRRDAGEARPRLAREGGQGPATREPLLARQEATAGSGRRGRARRQRWVRRVGYWVSGVVVGKACWRGSRRRSFVVHVSVVVPSVRKFEGKREEGRAGKEGMRPVVDVRHKIGA